MFVRTKLIRKRKYAYLVKNRWTKAGPRQKTVRYLGVVFEPEKISDEPFDHGGETAREIVESLVHWQLANYGFKDRGRSVWGRDDITVDLKRLVCSHAIKMESDFMCTYNLKRLMRFKSSGDQSVVGLALAKAFVAAGIPVPQEVFVEVFSKVYHRGQSFL
jgi:hypothetical protein